METKDKVQNRTCRSLSQNGYGSPSVFFLHLSLGGLFFSPLPRVFFLPHCFSPRVSFFLGFHFSPAFFLRGFFPPSVFLSSLGVSFLPRCFFSPSGFFSLPRGSFLFSPSGFSLPRFSFPSGFCPPSGFLFLPRVFFSR